MLYREDYGDRVELIDKKRPGDFFISAAVVLFLETFFLHDIFFRGILRGSSMKIITFLHRLNKTILAKINSKKIKHL